MLTAKGGDLNLEYWKKILEDEANSFIANGNGDAGHAQIIVIPETSRIMKARFETPGVIVKRLEVSFSLKLIVKREYLTE